MTERPSVPRPTPGAIFQPFDPADATAWEAEVAIRAATYPDAPPGIDALRFEDAQWDHARHWRARSLARDATDGCPLAYGQVGHLPWLHHPQRYGVTAMVRPDARGRGLGRAILDWAEATVVARGGSVLQSEVKADDPRSLAIAATRGYVERQQSWESRLAVSPLPGDAGLVARDGSPRSRAIVSSDVQAGDVPGITIRTLAEVLRDAPGEAAREALLAEYYALDVAATEDEPALYPITPSPYATWRAFAIDSPEALPDAAFLAHDTAHGNRMVGLSALYRNLGVAATLTQGFTAVARAYRGRGIAQALKARTVAYARANGYREIRTWNNSRNVPMLRINEAMGFVRQPAWVTVVKEVGDTQ
jgi:GNAT superfamily N-acetyltransferase